MKKLYRILALPFIFIMNVFIVWGGLVFPTTVIILFSLMGMLTLPFIGLINLSLDKKIKGDSPFIDCFDSYFLCHFLGFTCLIWAPFYATYRFYTDGVLIFKT